MISKQSKKEIFEGVQNIINESFGISDNATTHKYFNLKSKINYLLENCTSDRNLVQFLVEYKNMIEPSNEIFLLENFIQGLAQYKANSKVETVRRQLIDTINEHREPLQVAYLYESIQDNGLKELLKPSYSAYMNIDNAVSKSNFKEVLESVTNLGNAQVDKIYSIVNGKDVKKNAQSGVLFESYVPTEDEKETVDIEALKESINTFINDKLQTLSENVQPQEETRWTLSDIANHNGINLMESVVRLKKNTNNQKLHNILDEYYNALVNNAYEERLYETFYSNISNFSYLLPVETEMSSLNKRVNAVKQDIDLTKLLEMMQATSSYYIVPLIEHQVIDYIKNKTPDKKHALVFGLKPYGHDPYVRQIIEIVMADQDKKANVMGESVLSKVDRRKLVLENASVRNIYSPVQYVKENESVFNIDGIFYQKKGNLISRLDKTNISQLNEAFLELCQLVNDPRVTINENNTITITGNDKTAVISEGHVSINGNMETSATLRNLNEMYDKYNDYDTEFYVMTTCLFEHFNDIAHIDFAKRVVLNEDNSYSLDLFNVNSNLFIATHNDMAHSHIFYRNVNPIQCKNIINEHMGLNVSSLFEDILPNQKSILESLKETEETYEAKLEELRDLKDELQAKADECEDEDDKKKLEDAIKDCEKDIEDMEKEFKEWQEESDKAVNGDSVKDKDDDSDDDSDETDTDNDTEEEDPEAPKEDVTDDDIADYSQHIGDASAEEEIPAAEEMPADEEIPDEPADYDEEDISPMDFDTEDGMPNLTASDEEDPEFAPGDEDVNDNFDDEDLNIDDLVPAEELDDETAEDRRLDYEDGDEEFDKRFSSKADDILDDFDEGDEPTEEEINSVNVNTDEPKVTGIYFDENVKSGKIMRSGTISITEPMIDAEGNKYIDTKNIQFYIDDNDRPILNNSNISADIYNKAISAITSNPKFNEVVNNGAEAREDVVERAAANGGIQREAEEREDEVVRPIPDEDMELPADEFSPEELPEGNEVDDYDTDIEIPEERHATIDDINVDDFINGEEIEIPSYKDEDGTEIDLPANNIPFEEEDERGESDIIRESKKAVVGIQSNFSTKSGKRFALNEGKIKKSTHKKIMNL